MKEKLLNILKSIGLIFLILFFSAFFLMLFNIDITTADTSTYITYLTISNLIVIAIFIYIYRKTLISDFKKYRKNFFKYTRTGLKYWAIGFIIMLASNLVITNILKMGLAENEQGIRSHISVSPFFMFFNTVIYAPLTEELTFRKSIRDVISNKWFYIITSGLVFGLLHIASNLTSWTDLIYLIPYALS